MRIRRCAVVYFEPREQVEFDLAQLLGGGDGLHRERRWLALAPHLGTEVEVDGGERELLGTLSPGQWIEAVSIDADGATLARLLREGLIVSDAPEHAAMRERDESLRRTYWHPLAATLHAFTRWSGVDTVQNQKDSGTETAVAMRQVLGAPPVEAARRVEDDARVHLPRIAPTSFDDLLARRATCRNFDASRTLPFDVFAQVLQRVFAAQAEVRVTEDTVFLKKNVPSGGGLHPTETYLLVQRVEGLEPGLYHYHPVQHALVALPRHCERPLRDVAEAMLSGQDWFADAAAHLVLVPRFARTNWKYRNHAKAYRALLLDVGHISQAVYMAATEAGLAAFVTAAINEVDTEAVFALDGVTQSPVAVMGVGWRSATLDTAEFDPNKVVWP